MEKSCCANKRACQKNFKPLGDRVLLKRVEAETHSGGIILPESAKKKPEVALVVAVGPGKRDKEGRLIAMPVQVGDTVLVSKYSGQEVTLEGEEFLVASSSDIIAQVESD
ncbi:co-chaperone GroES [Candidatus Similichlamydia laticola]|uniref:Co-chaperonin GroES n=1 Tax=Candidatus Similichlamydia laticola TaxID=2170265 RepID=A0A369KAX3_9BACT|nr:co-chaperone GroES [Candidatus Similichlamydia laticola]RDB31759.1 Heat shock protein 60 family co-chaperone GroES [Candidatus Similichlamydia laticola]